jgi:hypothetical protein
MLTGIGNTRYEMCMGLPVNTYTTNSGSPARTDRIAFRAGALMGEITKRAASGSRDLTARRDLGRYYAILRRSLETVSFTRAELALICEAFKDRQLGENYDLIWAAIDDAIRLKGLEKKHQVDGPALVTKLRDLRPGQKLAVLDALEVCLHSPKSAALLEETGLVRD